jgi:hypothetical protein
MNAARGAHARARLGILLAWVVMQGVVGFNSLYVFSALLPSLTADPAIGASGGGWVPAIAQAGLMAAFIAWQASGRRIGRGGIMALLALLTVANVAMSVAPDLPTALVPAALVGVGSLVWNAMQAIISDLAEARDLALAGGRGPASKHRRRSGAATVVQWLGLVMLASGALTRWALVAVADQAGWRWALRALAVACVVVALILALPCFAVSSAAAGSPAATLQPYGRPQRRAAVWGSATVVLASSALALVDYYEPTALHAASFGGAVGPLGLSFLAGGLIAAVVVAWLRGRRDRAVLAATGATLAGAALDLAGELCLDGHAWLALLALGRVSIEWGTTVLTVSLGAIVGERYGHAGRFSRLFGFWRCAASTVMGPVAVLLYGGGGWLEITAAATVCAALAFVAARMMAGRVLADSPGSPAGEV